MSKTPNNAIYEQGSGYKPTSPLCSGCAIQRELFNEDIIDHSNAACAACGRAASKKVVTKLSAPPSAPPSDPLFGATITQAVIQALLEPDQTGDTVPAANNYPTTDKQPPNWEEVDQWVKDFNVDQATFGVEDGCPDECRETERATMLGFGNVAPQVYGQELDWDDKAILTHHEVHHMMHLAYRAGWVAAKKHTIETGRVSQ